MNFHTAGAPGFFGLKNFVSLFNEMIRTIKQFHFFFYWYKYIFIISTNKPALYFCWWIFVMTLPPRIAAIQITLMECVESICLHKYSKRKCSVGQHVYVNTRANNSWDIIDANIWCLLWFMLAPCTIWIRFFTAKNISENVLFTIVEFLECITQYLLQRVVDFALERWYIPLPAKAC